MADPGATAARMPGGGSSGGLAIAGGAACLLVAVFAWQADPRLGVAALGAPVAVGLLASPSLATALLFFSVPLEEVSAILPGSSLVKLIGLLAAGSWLLNVLVARERVRLPAVALPLLAFALWAVSSALWAISPGEVLRLSVTLAQLVALYLLVPNVLDTPLRLRRALDAHVAGAVVLAAVAIRVTEEGVLQQGRTAIVVGGQMLLESNFLAAALIVPVALALVGALDRARGRIARLLLAGAGTLCLAAIVLTMSRGAMLGVALVAAVVTVARGQLVVPLVGALLAAPGLALVGPMFWERWTEAATLADRAAGRLDILEVGWMVVRSRPLAGVGLGGFPLVYYDYLSEAAGVAAKHAEAVAKAMIKYPHNIYLGSAAELGVVGLGLLGVALAVHLRGAFRGWRALVAVRHPAAPLALAVVAALAALALQGASLDILYRKYFWMTLGLAALVHLRRPRPGGEPRP
jgi:O-antigen ligase